MKILALDSSAVTGTVALCEDDNVLGHFTITNGNTHSETLLPMAEQLLKLYGADISDIDVFACTSGPGSFTGVRIGVATVKGLAFGQNKVCIGVSTLEALAENLSCRDGIICPVMNARRGQVYNALFESRDGHLNRLCPDRALSIEELDEELSGKSVILTGDGTDITKEGFRKTSVLPCPPELLQPSGVSVARVARRMYLDGCRTTDVELHPIYLRMPQAERERLEKLNAAAEKAMQKQ